MRTLALRGLSELTRVMEEQTTAARTPDRPVAASIERLFGGWQFIWYDYEDHGPIAAVSDGYVNAVPPAYISHALRVQASVAGALDRISEDRAQR